mmetsp:Transcript_7409/g.20792  ORF Transcript_7409/g.20792 Transcript_7409/m.20792 type:complete len:441 (+) Transcript_7409:94-1416(+)
MAPHSTNWSQPRPFQRWQANMPEFCLHTVKAVHRQYAPALLGTGLGNALSSSEDDVISVPIDARLLPLGAYALVDHRLALLEAGFEVRWKRSRLDRELDGLRLPAQLVKVIQVHRTLVITGINCSISSEENRVVGLGTYNPDGERGALHAPAHLDALVRFEEREEAHRRPARRALQHAEAIRVAAYPLRPVEDVAVGAAKDEQVHQLLRAVAVGADHHGRLLVVRVLLGDGLRAPRQHCGQQEGRNPAARGLEEGVLPGPLLQRRPELALRREDGRRVASQLLPADGLPAARRQQHDLLVVPDVDPEDLDQRGDEGLLPLLLSDTQEGSFAQAKCPKRTHQESLHSCDDTTWATFNLMQTVRLETSEEETLAPSTPQLWHTNHGHQLLSTLDTERIANLGWWMPACPDVLGPEEASRCVVIIDAIGCRKPALSSSQSRRM